MINREKFQNKLNCTCNENVLFELIDDVECDWGNHTVIQCPNCEEIFSVDCECPAFQNILKLTKYNNLLYSDLEKLEYLKDSHQK